MNFLLSVASKSSSFSSEAALPAEIVTCCCDSPESPAAFCVMPEDVDTSVDEEHEFGVEGRLRPPGDSGGSCFMLISCG